VSYFYERFESPLDEGGYFHSSELNRL